MTWIKVHIRPTPGNQKTTEEVRWLRSAEIQQVYMTMDSRVKGTTVIRMKGDDYALNCEESVEQVLAQIQE